MTRGGHLQTRGQRPHKYLFFAQASSLALPVPTIISDCEERTSQAAQRYLTPI
jgi:hypothetical protein